MGFEQALSGLQGASQALDVIGNNIANASTIGYKDVSISFADVYAATSMGASSNQIGIGTEVAAVLPEFTQGNISTTGNPLDVAINGSGFFQMSTNGAISYTRDGEFSLDANGYIVNSAGAHLNGYTADAQGTISSAPPSPLQLSLAPVAPSATTTASVSVNLDSSSSAITGVAFNPSNSSSYNWSTSQTVYDSQGNSHTVSYYFVNTGVSATTGDDTWDVYATGDGNVLNTNPTTGAAQPVGTLTFNTSGTLTPASNVAMNISMPLTNGAASPLAFATTFPVASTTQYGVASSVSANTQNGYATGSLSSFSIGNTGIITGSYTNGQTVTLGQVALANFTNPQGLIATSGNQYLQSATSGTPQVGAPGTGPMGTVQSGALESSTVDITTELVSMITAQRVYQANAETVKTEDQVEQTLMNLR